MDGGELELAVARELFALARFSPRPGLGRMGRLLGPLAARAWWQGLDAIKVTGSNGKGTVASLTEAILRQLGLVTGLYTSPHLRHFAERFRLGGAPAGPRLLAEAMAELRPRLRTLAEQRDFPLAFEGMTALALHLFEEHGVQAAVLEAGIGGRHDATRRVPGRTAVLVSVDLEHTDLLGSTEVEIASDKADLAEDGGVLITGRLGRDLVRRLREQVDARGVELVELESAASWGRPRPSAEGLELDLEVDGIPIPGLRLPLHGEHHAENAALSVLAAWRWLRSWEGGAHRAGAGALPRTAPAVFTAAVRAALARCRLEGRFERVSHDPEVWIDIGHTPAACRLTARTARQLFAGRPLVLVLGVSHGKEPRRIAPPLAAAADRVIVTRAHHRGGQPERVLAVLERETGTEIETIAPLAAAMERATKLARREGAAVLVAGGLFLAIEAAEIVAGRDPGDLRFY